MISFELEKYVDTNNINKLLELNEILHEPKLTVKDTNIKYRVINHWDEKGLIRYTRKNELDSRRFSFIDFVWVKTIEELRSLGISIEVLSEITKEIYQILPPNDLLQLQSENLEMFSNSDYQDKEELIEFLKSGEFKNSDTSHVKINILEMLIMQAISKRDSVSIIVYKDGDWLPFVKQNEQFYDADLLHKMEFNSHIRVNLTSIIFNYLEEDYFGVYTQELKFFTQVEKYLLSLSRKGSFKKIIAKINANKQVEISKSKKSHQQLIQLFKANKCKTFYIVDENNKEFVLNEKILKEGLKKINQENNFDYESLTKFQFKNLI